MRASWQRLQAAARGPQGRTVVLLCGLVAGWRVLLEAVNHVVPRLMPVQQRYPTYLADIQPLVAQTRNGLGNWASWDGFHYFGIVVNGYQSGRAEYGMPLETAFFPAFSYLVRLLSLDGLINPIIVGLALNTVLTALAVIGIYFLAGVMVRRYAPAMAGRAHFIGMLAAIIFLVGPSSFFMAAFYADALLVAAGTWALVFALRQNFLAAALLSAVASGCKSSGAIIAVAVVLIYMEHKGYGIRNLGTWLRWRPLLRMAALGLASIGGMLAYMLACLIGFGDPLLFMKAQAMWNRHNTWEFPRMLYEHYYAHLLDPLYYGGTYGYIYMLMVQALPFIVILTAVWFGRRYKVWWPLIMTLVMLLLALASGIMQSLNRYCILLTPLCAVAALYVAQKRLNPYVVGAVLFASFQLLLYFTGAFLQGGHFAG